MAISSPADMALPSRLVRSRERANGTRAVASSQPGLSRPAACLAAKL